MSLSCPQRAGTGYIVMGDGRLSNTGIMDFKKHYDNFTLYETESLANKAVKLMRRSNAIIMACLLVDPDFEPDWSDMNSTKFALIYGDKEWVVAWNKAYNEYSAYVSTRAKAELVCKLLTE